jgi:hypothetical protein
MQGLKERKRLNEANEELYRRTYSPEDTRMEKRRDWDDEHQKKESERQTEKDNRNTI